MQMYHAECIFACGVYGAMNGEARGDSAIGRRRHYLALKIYLYQARSCDFLEHHPVGVDEKMMLRSGHACGQVSEDKIVPAVMRHQPVGGCKIQAHLPFLCGYRLVVGSLFFCATHGSPC